MTTTRRTFLKSGALFLPVGAALGSVVSATSRARAQSAGTFTGYGELVEDPEGICDLPEGFEYRVLSQAGEELTDGGVVPSNHDGMAAFSAGGSDVWLVRNHELDRFRALNGIPLPGDGGPSYDPQAVGGTTTLLVTGDRELVQHQISLAGTLTNCAGGSSPWGTWLTCEESVAVLSRPHGYVFEVDPEEGGNPEPIIGMGRFEHEAVAFDLDGRVYLTEDAVQPFGCVYRFTPAEPLGGRGSLHAGGVLEALCVPVTGDLSVIEDVGTVLPVRWVPVPDPNPLGAGQPVRQQVYGLGATPIAKAEGMWLGNDGNIWFTSSFARTPGSAVAHGGQIWRYDPVAETLELAFSFAPDSPFDGPDNVIASPYGFAMACTDGTIDNWLLTLGDDGSVAPFALNRASASEFAGATFSPDGQTLFVNIYSPGLTLAIFGPWESALASRLR